jgi:O-antigen ligase
MSLMNAPETPQPVSAAQLQSLSPSMLLRAFRQQPASFWFASAYLFFEYVRPQSIYPQIDVLPWPAVCIVLTLLFTVTEAQARIESGGISGGLVLMSLVVLLSAVMAEQPGLAFSDWRLFYDWVIIYFVVRRAVNDEVKLFLFIALFFLANFKMTQHGFFSWAARGFTFARWGVTGGPGWFHNSGEFGIQLCIFLPMLVSVALPLRHQWSNTTRLLIIFVVITGVSSVVASSSRGALLGLGAALLWMTMRSKYFLRAVIAVMLFAVLVYSNLPEESLRRFQNMGQDQTSLHRMERWRHAWQGMGEKPFLGVGYRNWDVYYPRHFRPEIPGPTMVHNIFLQVGTEMGFVGLGAFAWLIYLIFRSGKRVRKIAGNDPFLVGLSHGLDASTVGLLVSSCFVTVFYYPYVWIQCLFASCLYAVAVRKYPAAG